MVKILEIFRVCTRLICYEYMIRNILFSDLCLKVSIPVVLSYTLYNLSHVIRPIISTLMLHTNNKLFYYQQNYGCV